MAPEKQWMTTDEYAQATGMTAARVYKLIKAGKLAAVKVAGRWRIEAGGPPAAEGKNPPAAQPPSPAPAAPVGEGYAVADFAAMTYLTEKGVMRWLKQGRLKGRQGADGRWRVDPACLTDPHVERLLRR